LNGQIAKMAELPSLPQVLISLNRVARDSHASATDLSTIILKDQALTLRILKVVNSAYYHAQRREQVTTVSKAVVIIGFNGIRRLALGMSVYDLLRRGGELPAMQDFWSHSLATAITAQHLAEKVRFPSLEEAFVAGLVHDIGKLVLARCAPELYASLRQDTGSSGQLRAREREAFSLSHAQAGKKLAQRWGLPPMLEEAIGDHHAYKSSRLSSSVPLLMRTVIGANCFSPVVTGTADKRTAQRASRTLEGVLGLNQLEQEALYNRIVREYGNLAQTFEVEELPTPDTPPLSSLLRPEVDHEELTKQLQAISAVLVTAQSRQQLLGRILDAIMATLAIDRLFLLTGGQGGKPLACVASRGCATNDQTAAFDGALKESVGIARRTLRERRTIHVKDATAREVARGLDQVLLARLSTQEFATVPLLYHGRSVGLLWLDNPQSRRPLTKTLLDAVTPFTNSLALVLRGLQQPVVA
jgi:putative nucleotidyltransferase with HDIG domain